MNYQVLARKWRPRKFAEVVGQEHVLRALINALDNNRLHHAYLFTGTRGVGKTTLGRILAKSLNCETGVSATPCGVCSTCREIDEGRFVDLIEVDAASRTKVEDTRELLENVQYAPTRGRFKVYLIDEVHMLSNHSFNALLKTLEEPPPHVKFLLATTDPQRLPVTILSRCLKFNLKCIPLNLIVAHLGHILEQEGIACEQGPLALIARSADGSMRDALSLLDQAIAFGGGKVGDADVRAMLGSIDRDHVFALLTALADDNAQSVLECSAALAEQGADFAAVLAELISTLHAVALAQRVPETLEGEVNEAIVVRDLAQKLTPEDVQLYYQIGLLGRRDLPLAPEPRSGFEMVMLRMLAFRPVEDGHPVTAGKTPAASAAPRPAPAPPTPKPVTPAPRQAAAVPPQAAAPSRQQEAPAAPVAAAQPTERSVADAGADLDWTRLVQELGLTGMVKQLALNCACLGREGDTLRLVLKQAHAQLASRNLVERLQQALQSRLGNVKVVLDIGEPQVETPAGQQQRLSAQRQREAEQAIESDPVVRALEETFDARVDPKTVRPID